MGTTGQRLVIIDVRSDEAYAQGHMGGSFSFHGVASPSSHLGCPSDTARWTFCS